MPTPTTARRRVLVPMMLFALAGPALADVISVPADQPTIQAGIDAAVNGDEVVVAPGTYNEIIDFSGKDITVRSSGGAGVTTIDAAGAPDPGDGLPVVRFDSGEGPDAVLEGFTLTGGTGDTGAFGAQVGGGVFVRGADPAVRDCVIENNVVTSGGGGGVFVDLGSVVLDGCTIRFNQANDGRGGGIYVFGGSDLTMSGCRLDQNSAPNHSGLFLDGVGLTQDIRISDSMFENHTTDANTSVEFRSSGGTLVIERCVFRNNHSPDFTGGGLRITSNGVPVRVSNSLFVGNTGLRGGGADIDAGSETVVSNCAFVGNSATGGGGGISIEAPGTPLVNCSFWGNSAVNGAAIRANLNPNPTIQNCVVWGNTGSTQIEGVASGTLTVNNCIVEGGWGGAGTGNLDADPLFTDAAGGDLSLLPGSPAIDSGDTPAVAPVLGLTDLAGAPRLADDPATPDTGVPVFASVIDRGAYEAMEAEEPGGCSPVDLALPYGQLDFSDVVAFLSAFGAGCP